VASGHFFAEELEDFAGEGEFGLVGFCEVEVKEPP